ncbi:MAG: hypothetical protein HW419_1477 [Deltaproteobacteria bacterium]|nr:hypothetical protein [Deltaproteobacteria bacterium]
MQNTFIWIIIFAGAAIALLGVFLAASERELKKKRQEVEELVAKLGEQPAAVAAPTVAMAVVDSEKLDALQARNQELENEIATASSKLELSRRAIEELQDDQRRVETTQSNAQWVQSSNDQLTSEIENLKQRLQASEARVNDSSSQSQDATERQRQLQAEVATLQQQLMESQSKLREFDGVQQKLANIESIEASHRDARQALETRIADLQKELSSGAEKVRELDALRERLAESERNQQALREESLRHNDEIARWQGRVNEAGESRRQFAQLREPFDTLLAKQTALEERQREFKGELYAFAQLMSKPFDGSSRAALNESRTVTHTGETTKPQIGVLEKSAVMVAPTQVATAQTSEKAKRRFGIFPAMILLAGGGALLVALWSSQTVEGPTPAVTASATSAVIQKKDATPKVDVAKPEPVVSGAPAPIAQNEPAKTPAKETIGKVKPVQTAKNEARLAGTYEITQASRVYAAPSEFSQLVGDIEPGVRVNVVNGKDGWLEIHSKHGRPPGFIRRESARAAPQN